MAQDSPTSQSADDLIAEISRNRNELAEHRAALRRASHVGDRMQRSYHDHTGLFLGSAAVLGLLVSVIPSRRRCRTEKPASLRTAAASGTEQRKRSRSMGAVLVGLLGKIALDMGKPILLKMVRDRYLRAGQPQSPPP